jgi:HD-GYP domain-containing protein (c-di-GMP phosphodiesterase class II)
LIEQLIIHIAAAINMWTLYPPNHPRVVQSVTQILTTLKTLLQERSSDSVTFLIVGEDLVVEQEVFRRASLSQRHFVQALKRRDVERLTLAEGLEPVECLQFIAALAMGETPRSSSHIILGRVQVALGEKSGPESKAAQELSTQQLDVVREAFAQFRKEETLPLGKMEELVWSFIDSLSRTTRAILPLAKLKEHDEYTFIHSVNVSLLVLAQARSYGIQGSTLHAFGMAGLLHDIGKLMVPIEVLNFPGKLEGENWNIMKTHAEQGAWFLSEMEGSNPLSTVVAYEHHMRFDGEANYPTPRVPRRPNLASRMTSIADTYDAMATLRPYQKPKMRATAFQILRERAGTFYDPLLVENFARLVG